MIRRRSSSSSSKVRGMSARTVDCGRAITRATSHELAARTPVQCTRSVTARLARLLFLAAMGYLDDAAPASRSSVSLVFLPARAAAVAMALSSIASTVSLVLVIKVCKPCRRSPRPSELIARSLQVICAVADLDGNGFALVTIDGVLLACVVVTGIVIIVCRLHATRPAHVRLNLAHSVRSLPPTFRNASVEMRSADYFLPDCELRSPLREVPAQLTKEMRQFLCMLTTGFSISVITVVLVPLASW